MADRNGDNRVNRNAKDPVTSDHPENTEEGLIGQTGEDHNLSGSSTYRTLPDQGPSEPGRVDQGPDQNRTHGEPPRT